MLVMALKMIAIAVGYVVLTLLLWRWLKGKKITWYYRLLLGFIYGMCSVLSTHFGVPFGGMIINERDLGPLCAGLFFDPVSGIIAGIIGGVERYIAGAYFNVGSYTKVACSVSTCLAGFVAAFMSIFIFKRKKPSGFYAFFMGAVMEVFHMYVVLITHRDDMSMAYYVVKICAIPMIIFCGIGLAASAIVLKVNDKEWHNPLKRPEERDVKLSQKIQIWLFMVTSAIIFTNFLFSFTIQTQSAIQDTREDLAAIASDIRETYDSLLSYGGSPNILRFHIGSAGSFDLVQDKGYIFAGSHQGKSLDEKELEYHISQKDEEIYHTTYFGVDSFCRIEQLNLTEYLVLAWPSSEVYYDRDADAYETAFADILLLTVIYVLISLLIQAIVVDNLDKVNDSLNKITDGDLNETVSVYNSEEFASLSDDINETVDALKGYIDAAEKRIAQELEFAKSIQESALPKNFNTPRQDIEIFASMDPAKEVGGDFYDFFFIDKGMLVLVIADVSGKGIPASLFMMRSMSAIRSTCNPDISPSEVLAKVNNLLCEGNETDMFVTVWIGIINLGTGLMRCANAGHEYPVLRRAGQDYELFKDPHSPALATMEGVRFKDYELQLNRGDELFVYTDGVPEAINEQIQQYGVERLIKCLNNNKDVSPERLLPRVTHDLAEFVGNAEQFDDVTMLGFKYKMI